MTMCQCAGCFPERQAKKAFDRRMKIDEAKRSLKQATTDEERNRLIRKLVNSLKPS